MGLMKLALDSTEQKLGRVDMKKATNHSQQELPGVIAKIQACLDLVGAQRKVMDYQRSQIVYSQDDSAHTVMCIQKGEIKLSVVNDMGKEAVVGILRPGDFFGESCLAGQTNRSEAAIALSDVTLLVIDKREMLRALREPEMSECFMSFMLARNIRIQEDLVDHFFNSSEKRLARTLLMLARHGEEDQRNNVVAALSQQTLAEIVGTTRSRVNLFMNQFKKRGFVNYSSGRIHVNPSLLSAVLHD